jgi:hypothetical protein
MNMLGAPKYTINSAGAAACAQGKNNRENDAHHVKKRRASSRVKGRRQ